MADDWVEGRDKAVLNTVYYCETCNMIIELGDADILIHKRDLPHHKILVQELHFGNGCRRVSQKLVLPLYFKMLDGIISQSGAQLHN